MREKSAVSPIIGVLLLIVITMVIAAAVYLWVSNLLGGGAKTTPTVKMTAERADKNYTVIIDYVSRAVDIDAVRFYILEGGKTIASGSPATVFGNLTGNIGFIDMNYRKDISVDDIFIIRGEYAKSGNTIQLKYISTGDLMGEVTLP